MGKPASSKGDVAIGDRVRMSALGAARFAKLAKKSGIVIGRGVYSRSVRIRFDGNKSESTFHLDFLEKD